MLDAELARADLDGTGDEPIRIARLRDWVWARVYTHYVAERGLRATAEEVAELQAYDREFERRDRLQRARKLAELDERLAKTDLDPAERAWLQEFRQVLIRMAERETQRGGAAPDENPEPGYHTSWIEFWKVNQALYEEFHGTVELTSAGPAAHGARRALLEDYERRGIVQFFDSRLREAVIELMNRPPRTIVPPQEADFTPYWRRPIPPSYFPD